MLGMFSISPLVRKKTVQIRMHFTFSSKILNKDMLFIGAKLLTTKERARHINRKIEKQTKMMSKAIILILIVLAGGGGGKTHHF